MSSHRILNDLLRAFTTAGAGYVAATATSDGSGTGTLLEDRWLQFVVPTWGAADNIIVLPSPEPGKIVILAGAATGGELRTSDPATIAINTGTVAAGAESEVAASLMVIAICESATMWKAFGIASDGTVAGLTGAAA